MTSEKYNRNSARGQDRKITRIRISPEIREEALNRAKDQEVKYNSGLGKEADLKGYLGEVASEYWMDRNDIRYKAELDNKKHDYRLKESGFTFDVKTKDRNFEPLRKFDCTVPFYNHDYQRSDFFLFVSLLTYKKNDDLKGLDKFEYAYIVGSTTYKDLEDVGVVYLRDEQDWSNGTVMWTTALNVQMYQLISVEDTISLFQADKDSLKKLKSKPKEDSLFNIPVVSINEELEKETKSRIESGKLLNRPFPPWDAEKHNEVVIIDKKIEKKYIIHPLDRELVKYRIKNIEVNLQKKINVEPFLNELERSGWFVHQRAIRDFLKRYELYWESEKNQTINRFVGDDRIDSIIRGGKSQKAWLPNRLKS